MPGPSNPLSVDSDGDALLDADERDYATSPYRADTDGDTLSDARELLTTGSDPLHRNVDGDGRDDAEGVRKDTDPYYRDLQGWDHGVAAVAYFIWGESGERAVRWHLLDRSTLESFSYLSGWLASGFALIGDIRDAGSSLWDQRYGDAALSAVGLIPLVGDAGKLVANSFGTGRIFELNILGFAVAVVAAVALIGVAEGFNRSPRLGPAGRRPAP